MTEKYKIYLSEETRSKLVNDAELFEFNKKDESVNLNAFLKVLIVNYFEKYRHDSDKLIEDIISDLTSASKIKDKEAAILADKIVNTYIRKDDGQSGKSAVITLTVSGASYDVIKIIEHNMLKDKSLSQYLKDMFSAYLSIPRSSREAIIFSDTYEDISRAIKDSRIMTFTTTAVTDHTFTVEPYMIAPSKEEQCNYLLCRDARTKKARTFRISRIRSAFVTSSTFTEDPDFQESLREKAIRSPHSVSPDVHAVVRLTPNGIKKFKMVTKNRPLVSEINGNLYSFDWPEMQLEEYFKRFGKDAVVIKPRSLKSSIRTFYSTGLKAYE